MNAKYLCFEELETKPKTKQFAVKNTSGFMLGVVKWYAPWRKYCFFNTAVELVFDAGCLEDIKDFLNKLMLERKAGMFLDIRFRMLKNHELKRAQGFPDDYILKGNTTEQTKQIGNAVP